MSLPLRLSPCPTPFSCRLDCSRFAQTNISRLLLRFPFLKSRGCLTLKYQNRKNLVCSLTGDGETTDVSEVQKIPDEHAGSKSNGSHFAKAFTSNEVMLKLRRYGVSGVLSYGLLNTAYYLITFILVWFYVAPAQGRMGYVAAVERFLKIMAMVWAGSQVTKLVRAGGALALAPLVDRGLSWFTVKFKFESQGKAFVAIAGFCFGLALLLFFVVTLLCA